MTVANKKKIVTRKWYERYLPFVAQSPQMRIKWLVAVIRKGTLSLEEVTPYIRLLLEEAEGEGGETLRELFRDLDEKTISEMVRAADIYDLASLFRLIPAPTVEQAVEALGKAAPPYEKRPNLLYDKVLQAVHDRSEAIFEQAAAELERRVDAPPHFKAVHERFQEILADERILSTLYPKARN